jgi:thioesterase domain-containing protein
MVGEEWDKWEEEWEEWEEELDDVVDDCNLWDCSDWWAEE